MNEQKSGFTGLCCPWKACCPCNHLLSITGSRASLVIPPCQRSRYATYFDVAVLRCLLQPHWSEEGTQWSLMYYLQRLRHMLEEKPEKAPDPDIPLLPRPRSSSMVAAAPSLVNTHKTQVRRTWSIVACAISVSIFCLSSGFKLLRFPCLKLLADQLLAILLPFGCMARTFGSSSALLSPLAEVSILCMLI